MKLFKDVIRVLTPELRYRSYNNSKTLSGYCYIISEAIYHLWGKKNGYHPYYINYHGGETHWYLKNDDGDRIDLVANSYKRNPFSYKNEVKCGFLTKKPCKRTRIILERLK